MKNPQIIISNDNSQNFRELSVITKISQSIIKTLDYDEILQIISNGMSELLEIEKAAIYVLEDETKLYLRAATPPLNPDLPDIFRRANLSDHPHIETAISTQKSLFISDTQAVVLSEAEKNIIKLSKARSILYLPFIKEKKALGILILTACEESKHYSERQIELGQTVANQLSVAIQNSQLHHELLIQNENLELLVAERTCELEAANEELRTANEELYFKNKLVQEQNDEIEKTLKDLKAAQNQLIQSEKMASLGVLTAGVAHEINNPLNFIMGGYTGLINELKTCDFEKDERISVYLNGIKTGVDRAADIVKGLNQISRSNDSFDEKCNLHTILDNCLTVLYSKYKDNIVITKEYYKSALYVNGNNGKLHQVFMNIISNAIDSIEHHGVISIETNIIDNNFEVAITDTGCGISSENLKKVFDPFFTTKEPGKGTGLGLYITNSIVEQHKGNLQITSTLNKGTKVIVNFSNTSPNEQ
jgi:signal transduction histidine kinase